MVKYAIGLGPLDSAAGRIPQKVLQSTVNDESYPTVCFARYPPSHYDHHRRIDWLQHDRHHGSKCADSGE